MTGNSLENRLSHVRPYVLWLMKQEGRDFTKCELCGNSIKSFDIHHTRYEGATYYDLRICCRSCNLKAENKYLA